MTTANLNILEAQEYELDSNDYYDFMEDLKLWASKWVPEIGIPIAKASNELFKDAAVRMLLHAWAEMERKDMTAYDCAFDHAANGDDVDADDFKGIGTFDKAGYSQALYLLLVK